MKTETADAVTLRIGYEDGTPSTWSSTIAAPSKATCKRVARAVLPRMDGLVYLYASIDALRQNPVPYAGGVPDWDAKKKTAADAEPIADLMAGYWLGRTGRDPQLFSDREPYPVEGYRQCLQTISVGCEAVPGSFIPLVRFGLANDGRAMERAHVVLWLSDGNMDHYGPYARPGTAYDYRIRLDLGRRALTAWACCRGDGDWFLLVEGAALSPSAARIDAMRVELYPGAPAVDLTVAKSPIGERERVRMPQSLGERGSAGLGQGFRFQSMRSVWRQPGRHVTVYRDPQDHAGFPELARAGGKHLICVWARSSHTGGKGGSMLAHSHDGGLSWSDPTLFNDTMGLGRIQALRDGSLLLQASAMPEKSASQYDAAAGKLLFYDSLDGGLTWVNLRCLDAGSVGGDVVVSGRVTELSDGSWFLSCSSFFKAPVRMGLDGGDEGNLEKLEFFRSGDRGNTWERLSGPNAWPPYCLSEPSALELPDGRILVYARETRSDGLPGARAISSDGGRTWAFSDLPFPIIGRTCAGLLADGRVMMTFRSGIGRQSLWAWIGNLEDMTGSQPMGVHFNDAHTVGLRDGELHIENEGSRGQFTMYSLRPADSTESAIDLEFEVKVIENRGKAATVSVPFGGKLRIFPDHIAMAHDSDLKADIAPAKSHRYRVTSRVGSLKVYVDGALAIDTDKGDSRLYAKSQYSRYGLAFGNEPSGLAITGSEAEHHMMPAVLPEDVTPEVHGRSIWRCFKARTVHPGVGERLIEWSAGTGGFPDQYQLDHMIEIEASVTGGDQGYSGWVQMDDGSVYVANYTDDDSYSWLQNPFRLGVPWIRGTIVRPEDLG